MITEARNRIQLPATPIARRGVLAVADVIEAADAHDLLGVQYETDACLGAFGSWTEFCTAYGTNCPSYVPPALVKTFLQGPETIVGDPFAIYAGLTCDIMRMGDVEARVRSVLAYNEHRLVDEDFQAFALADPDDVGTIASLPLAIGALEHHLALEYGGEGIIFAGAGAVESMCAQNLVCRDLDGTLRTCLGTKVSVLYSPTTFAATPALIYITGRVTLIRGPVEYYTARPQELCDGEWAPPRALAERIYVPLVECVVASVEWTPPA
jgi:hypothetical protein